ncbi:MAG: histidine phosphotransfer protein HptB [Thermoplasmata archaeon]|jgi:HPt (histidine-containing phosphotransfer) domain-containing protein|nr:histidine phosphotransfer protein HptB [Thermoplasmata archaeon]
MIDEATLRQLIDDMGGDMEVVRELMQSFLEEAPKLIAEGRQAAGANDAPTLQRALHTLKSTAATFGALQLSTASKNIEHAARAGTIATPAQLDEVDRLWAATKPQLLQRIG